MNVSVSGLFSNCYNYINNQLSNLSPLQKKVALFAVAYFSCATVGYFIYRLYCFHPHPVQESEKDEEIISMSHVERRNVRDTPYKQKKSQSVTKHQEEPYKKWTKIEIKKDELELISEEESSGEELLFEFEEAKKSLEVKKEPGIEEAAYKQTEETLQKADELGQKMLLKDVLPLIEDNPFTDWDLEALYKKESPKKKDPSLSSFPPLTLSPILTFKPKPQDDKQIEIEKRLEKNCAYAIAQQKEESSKHFSLTIAESVFTDSFGGRPITVSKQKDSHHRSIGIASCQGPRSTMEDTSDATTLSFAVNEETYEADVLGVFDGHGGDQASLFVKENFAKYLKEALENHNSTKLTDVGIWDALKSCFKKLDEDYQGFDGTTATVALILNDKIWVANVGDSRTILVKKDGVATQASEDAKPNMERYKKKIEKLGGSVEFWGCWRVNGNLAVARAIGDKGVVGKEGQCCVSPNPKITCYSLKDYVDGYLVLACDGLYDVATTDEVGKAIKNLADFRVPAETMAKSLTYSALSSGSKDNVSVVVVGLTQ